MKILTLPPLLSAGLLLALCPAPAHADCSGEQINNVCFIATESGVLERSPDRLDKIQQANTLQITVEVLEEMEVAIAAPQLIAGPPDPSGSQQQASLSALGSSITSDSSQAITLPTNQSVTLTLSMDVVRPEAFTPNGYSYSVPLNFSPTAAGGSPTAYDLTFIGSIETTCLNDGVTGGTLAKSGYRSLSSTAAEGMAGGILNLRCNADVNVSATATPVAATSETSNFFGCNVQLATLPLLPCDASSAALLAKPSLPLSNTAVNLELSNYQAAPGLPAGSYEYVVTLTLTP